MLWNGGFDDLESWDTELLLLRSPDAGRVCRERYLEWWLSLMIPMIFAASGAVVRVEAASVLHQTEFQLGVDRVHPHH